MGTKIALYIWALLLIIGGTGTASWFMSKQVNKCNTETIDLESYQTYVDSTKVLIDSIDCLNAVKRKERAAFDSLLVIKDKAIATSNRKLKSFFHEVDNTNTSELYHKRDSILSRYRQYTD